MTLSAPYFRALVASATKFTRKEEPTTSSNQSLPSLVMQRLTRGHAGQRGHLSRDTLSSNSIMLSSMFLIGTLRRGLL